MMAPGSPRWKAISPSQFPWEQEALDFVREALPERDPYRAWSNFELIADDGSINEIDLLVLTEAGFYLVEIKSRPGALTGDSHSWTWTTQGREYTQDHPRRLAQRKAQRLAAGLRRLTAARKLRVPFLEPVVFCSAKNLKITLPPEAGHHVFDRDGFRAFLLREPLPDSSSRIDGRQAREIERALDQLGVRPSESSRRVGDYRLEELLFDGAYYQDWLGRHTTLPDFFRRVRLFPVATGRPELNRQSVERAAQRDFRLLQHLDHPGVLRALDYKSHELGPALIFEHRPESQRLDHYLSERGLRLDLPARLRLARQAAEAVHHAHGRGIAHRALSPQCVLVEDPEAERPQIKIFNWQTGARRDDGAAEAGRRSSVSAGTRHLMELIDPAAEVYLAPELRTDPQADGELADIFSLGALLYILVTGKPPADSFVELARRLQSDRGLLLSGVLDGVGPMLSYLVATATLPEVTARYGTVAELLEYMEEAEREGLRDKTERFADPETARAGDRLEGGFTVVKRLPAGSTSWTFRVQPGADEREQVLKLSRDAHFDDILAGEAEVLDKLRHSGVVELQGKVEIGGRVGLLLEAADETLAQRLREKGRLSLDFLERFGEELLRIVEWLEEQGIPHRDLKPDNLGTRSSQGKGAIHLVLFDFSLSRASLDELSLGTPRYLDPFLPHRKQRRWDLHAERYAAAVTLYEMATGTLPRAVGEQGGSSGLPSEIQIEPELFDAAVREPLSQFFRKAFAAEVEARFAHAGEMLRDWQRLFLGLESPAPATQAEADSTAPGASSSRAALALATLESHILELELSARARHALERVGIADVRGLLETPLPRFTHMPGVGQATRRELVDAVRALRPRFPAILPAPEEPIAGPAGAGEEREGVDTLSLDALVAVLFPERLLAGDTKTGRAVRLFFGLEPERGALSAWPSQSDAAAAVGATRALLSGEIVTLRRRFLREPAMTVLREDVAAWLGGRGGVMSAEELEQAVRAGRGSTAAPERADALAHAVVRAVIEADDALTHPALLVERVGEGMLVALDREGERSWDGARLVYARRLGGIADRLAALDPLPAPATVAEDLRAVALPEGMPPLPLPQLVRLAAAASQKAAVSPRLELYPRDLSAERAVRLSAGGLSGAKELAPEQVRARVRDRFPLGAPLPELPGPLEELLSRAGLDLVWDGAAERFVSPGMQASSILTATSILPLAPPGPPSKRGVEPFLARLGAAVGDGSFLALAVARSYREAAERLADRFPATVLSLEHLLLERLRAAAARLGADWKTVLAADATSRTGSDWRKLQRLIDVALPEVEEELAGVSGLALLTWPGLLARYQRFDLLERLRERLLSRTTRGLAALWVLLPVDAQGDRPMLDGQPVPLLPGELAVVPDSFWEMGAG